MPDYQRVLAIINPVSGTHNPDDTAKLIRERLEPHLSVVEVRFTTGANDALNWAQGAVDEGFDLVLVAGGDGTVVEAMTGLIKGPKLIPLAQLPTGTASQIARALSISLNLEEAIELVYSGRTVYLDTAYLPQHDRYFALISGAGFDARVMEAPRGLKRRLGFFAYVLMGIWHIFNLRKTDVTLELDDHIKKVRAHTVLIANIGRIDDIDFAIGPDIWHHDGTLDVIVVASLSFGDILRLSWRVLTGNFSNYRDLRYYKARRVRIDSKRPLPVQIDGDPLGTTPLEAEVVPDGVLVLVPQHYVPRKHESDPRQRSTEPEAV
ncbi:MAG: diacylglycerol kinase family protein [Trueperaceae bacterium]|nr:diacylglycerol kinase family protein [Trueperaceae bacterium]